MDSSRQEYPALLGALQPEQAINVLNDRVYLINKVNTDIADWLQERRRIEERYAADLRKLARRPQQDGATALGIFQMPWQRIVSGCENLAQSHETLASKIETDVETPLKQYSTKNREMQAITTIQGNINSIARDLTKAREKADKLSARGSRKAGDASSNVDGAAREWESQAPYVFEQLQALDEHRINHLRDVLTQFQTHEADSVEKNRNSTESCLNALLNIETADEIKTFAMRVSTGQSTSLRRPSSAVPSEGRAISSSSNVPPTPPPPRNPEQRVASAPSQDRLAPLPETTPQKGKLGGLKRLGTVMGRRKNAAPPPPPSEKKKERTKSFVPFRRADSSRSFQDLEETGRDLTPITSQAERENSQVTGTSLDQPSEDNRLIDTPSPAMNGTQTTSQTHPSELPAPLVPTSAQTQEYLPPLQPTQPLQAPQITAASPSVTTPASPIPAVMTRDDVFAPQSPDTPSSLVAEESGRNLKIRDQPIQEDASEAELAMNNMANQLRLQAQNSGVNRVQGSVRGRRDVRNTMFVANPQEMSSIYTAPSVGASSTVGSTNTAPTTATSLGLNTPELTPTTKRSVTPGTIPEDHATVSDATSVHSAASLANMAHHPDLYAPGLNASIVETISTWFSESGVTRSFVVGEVAFSHVTSPTLTPHDQEIIRVQNFQALEKVAANPTFVTPYKSPSAITEEQAGSYNIALTSIRRSTPTVGLKYQLHMDQTNLTQFSPILITPAWQIVEGQASIIVLYSLNPGFAFPAHVTAQNELILKNVSIAVNLDIADPTAAKPSSAVMAPQEGGHFRRKAGSVIWRLPELKVHVEQQRLLVRFYTEAASAIGTNLAKKGGVEVKFELHDISAGGLGIEKLSHESGGATAAAESDPFADEEEARKSGESSSRRGETWELIPTRMMLVSGRYAAV